MKRTFKQTIAVGLLMTAFASLRVSTADAQPPIVPPAQELNAPFGAVDRERFASPPAVYHPETWFHFIGRNISKAGITADIEAIAAAGISGIQFFHGQFGGDWPKVDNRIVYFSPEWEDAVRHTAQECRRLGLRFTMQNCPGWAMAGGPWITPENAMRQLAYSRTDVEGGGAQTVSLPLPAEAKDHDWRDWRYLMTLAFPTPEGDPKPLRPVSARSSKDDIRWTDYFNGTPAQPAILPPTASADSPHWIEVSFDTPVILRTVEFPVRPSMHWWYDPAVKVRVQALRPDGSSVEVLNTAFPQSNWMDRHPLSLACNEAGATSTYRIIIDNRRQTTFSSLRLYSSAVKHSYEGEAGWSLRSIDRQRGEPLQSAAAHVDYAKVIDLTASTDTAGNLTCTLPAGKWTVLRIGHINSGMRNGPAPPEGRGWECNKLANEGAEAHFAGYIGRLSGKDAPVGDGLLNGMLMDSWECYTQTWTADLEEQFRAIAGYDLRQWMPAVFGYVMNDSETTTRFLRDWRAVIGKLFAERFYGRMSALAHEAGLGVQYESAAGDIFPADIMEYYKYADVPMCEFWHPYDDGVSPLRGLDGLMGALNFKPIKPTASAARMYGKPRVAAEAFTSLDLSWDEHPEMLKGVANLNMTEGVTHLVFHTYTHNPQIGFLPPGTSFGARIGTPFLRGQTWWKHMPEFTTYLARCNYLLERGQPVSDVLWYLGDEVDHKPDQNAPFPDGYKYDYCNPDVLLNRLSVRDGHLVTPEGIAYRLLWIPQNERMLPETLEKILALTKAGATVVGKAPRCIATLSGGKKAQQRFNKAVKTLWGDGSQPVRNVGKGRLLSGTSIDDALTRLNIEPDVKVVKGSAPLWSHRRVDGADWYFVCAPHGTGSEGVQTRLSFRQTGEVEVWNPVTGEPVIERSASAQVHFESAPSVTGQPAIEHNGQPYSAYRKHGNRTEVALNLPPAGSYFVVFKPESGIKEKYNVDFTFGNIQSPLNNWTLLFPSGWGIPEAITLDTLKAWKDLNISAEGRAFSGTAVYSTTFEADESANICWLDLGRVEMIASVSLNGKHVRTLWARPYTVDLSKHVQPGVNTLSIEVTSSWFNRLVYDASLPEAERRTWTIEGPSKDAPLRESGLLGPVRISGVKPATTMRYLENGRIKLGIDLSIGGAVTYLSDRENGGQNMINSADWGRQIQMSYYSGPRPYIGPNGEQPEKHWAGLGWNPIQSGDAGNNRSKVTAFEERGANAMFVRCIPMQWTHRTGVPGDCEFECLYTLEGNVITMEATIVNKRSDTAQYHACPQEMPAVYTNGTWYNLVCYLGDEPFMGKPVTQIVARNDGKGWPWRHLYTPENWVAILDDNGKGLGVFQPEVMNFNVGFHPGEALKGSGGEKDAQTGHIAPVGTQILDHDIRWTYKTSFILGTTDDIRSYAKEHKKDRTPPAWRFDRSRQNWYYGGEVSDAGWATKGFLDLRFKKNASMASPVTFWKAVDAPFLDIEGAFTTASGEITLRIEIQPVSKSDFTDWLNWSEGQQNAETEKEQKTALYPASPPIVHHQTVKADGVNRIHRINLANLPEYKKAFKSVKISFSEEGTARVRRVVVSGK